MARLCARPACSQPAAATLFYDYDGRTAWFEELGPDRDPAGYELCVRHVQQLTVPQGWTRSDRRSEAAGPQAARPEGLPGARLGEQVPARPDPAPVGAADRLAG